MNRKVETSITKRTRLEKLASVINKRYIESDSNDSCYSEDDDDNKMNSEVAEEENIILNDEKDFSESDERNEGNKNINLVYNNEDLRFDLSSHDSSYSENNSDVDEEKHLQFADENERSQYVVRMLREWVQEGGIMSMRKLDSLLEKLHCVFPIIPLCYKTL